ncbi:MAG: ABC transporter permease, partial [Deltaproteobacteria bacterium]|nr:ABC transporter permease [Deltaproteobacteria bacterium]
MKILPLVLKNLLRKKTRSLLTIGSIVLPLFVICILGTLLQALEADPSGGKGMYRIIVRHKVSITNWLPGAYDPKIRNLPGVVETLRMNWFGGSYVDQSAKNQFARFSTSDADRLLKVFDEAK